MAGWHVDHRQNDWPNHGILVTLCQSTLTWTKICLDLYIHLHDTVSVIYLFSSLEKFVFGSRQNYF